MPKINESKIKGIIDLLEQLYKLGDQRDDDKISTFELFRDVEKLIADNTHFALIEKVKQFSLSIEDTYLFILNMENSVRKRIYRYWKSFGGYL